MTPQERALEAVREFSEEPWQVSASSGIVSVVTRHIAAAVAEERERNIGFAEQAYKDVVLDGIKPGYAIKQLIANIKG